MIKTRRRKAALKNKEAMQKLKQSKSLKQETPILKQKTEPQLIEQLPDIRESDSDRSLLLGMTDQQIKDFKKAKNLRKQQEQLKLSLSKISYTVQPVKDKFHFPIMQEKALNEQEEEDPRSILNTTRSVLDKNTPVWTVEQPIYRNTMIRPGRFLNSRGGCGSTLPQLQLQDKAGQPIRPRVQRSFKQVTNQHFLSTTKAQTNRNKSPTFKQTFHLVSRYQHIKTDKLFHDTISTSCKQTHKRRYSTVKPWVPVANRKSSYVPGIDNQWYIPYQWRPEVKKIAKASDARPSTSPVFNNRVESF